MINAINYSRDFLSWKVCFLYVAFCGVVLVLNFLYHAVSGNAPVIWHGTCEATMGSKYPYAKCQINGTEFTSDISAKTLYQVLKENKPLVCDLNDINDLNCQAGE
jgi:hypothetical protein